MDNKPSLCVSRWNISGKLYSYRFDIKRCFAFIADHLHIHIVWERFAMLNCNPGQSGKLSFCLCFAVTSAEISSVHFTVCSSNQFDSNLRYMHIDDDTIFILFYFKMIAIGWDNTHPRVMGFMDFASYWRRLKAIRIVHYTGRYLYTYYDNND